MYADELVRPLRHRRGALLSAVGDALRPGRHHHLRKPLSPSYNADLANTLGNLVNRSIAMANKYFGGVVSRRAEAFPEDGELRAAVGETVEVTAG